jgi:hypothetical protein
MIMFTSYDEYGVPEICLMAVTRIGGKITPCCDMYAISL